MPVSRSKMKRAYEIEVWPDIMSASCPWRFAIIVNGERWVGVAELNPCQTRQHARVRAHALARRGALHYCKKKERR